MNESIVLIEFNGLCFYYVYDVLVKVFNRKGIGFVVKYEVFISEKGKINKLLFK